MWSEAPFVKRRIMNDRELRADAFQNYEKALGVAKEVVAAPSAAASRRDVGPSCRGAAYDGPGDLHEPSMNPYLLASLVLGSALVATTTTKSAFADDKLACVDAAFQGDSLRLAHKLVDARQQLLACVRSVCPPRIQVDCANGLAEVERALPTVVITAKNPEGRDVYDVTVSLNGRVLATKLQGESLPLDPGVYTLHFEAAGGVVLDRRVLVKEGMKSQDVAVVLPGPLAAPAPAAPSSLSTTTSGPHAVPEGNRAWRTVGWVVGAVGVAGLGVGIGFGVKAISDKSAAHCDASRTCDPGPLSDANGAATVSTVGFVAGGVLLAGGVTLALVFPRRGTRSAATGLPRVALVPTVGRRDGGLSLRGSW